LQGKYHLVVNPKKQTLRAFTSCKELEHVNVGDGLFARK
jgi:hypothetical protein